MALSYSNPYRDRFAWRRQQRTHRAELPDDVLVASREEATDWQLSLEKVLSELTPKQRSAFVLRDLQGFPFEEVAEILDCSRITARVHSAPSAETVAPTIGERAMICLVVKRLLPLYAGGDWGKGLTGWTERHLSQCPGCLAEYEALSAARDQVRKLAAQNAPRPSVDLAGRTIAQLATDATEIRGRFAWACQDRGGRRR